MELLLTACAGRFLPSVRAARGTAGAEMAKMQRIKGIAYQLGAISEAFTFRRTFVTDML